MAKVPVFISFDYDHDRDLKQLLVGQSRHPDSPFHIQDWSIKQETKNWEDDARTRICRCNLVLVICGLHTHRATGVAPEIGIAKEEKVDYFLLRRRKTGWVRRSSGTFCLWDDLHAWKWDKLRSMTTLGR